jgi:DNA-binding SARP family transcriptional activator
VEFLILGPLEVLDGDLPIEIAGSKRRALLALLVLRANEVIRTDRLIDDLWGERPPANATAALQNHVSRLRKSLGADVLIRREWGYALRTPPESIDLRRFEGLVREADPLPAGERALKLGEAMTLWRGAALSDLSNEPALQHDLARLEELRVSTIERRVDADLEAGRNSELIGELETLIAQHPLREHLRSQLILALYRAGRQAEALEVYRETRRVLAEELGLDPSPELRELERAILRQDPSLAAAPGLPPRPDAPERPVLPPASRRRRWLAGGIAGVLLLGAVAIATVVVTREGVGPSARLPPAGLVDGLGRTGKGRTVADRFDGEAIDPAVWYQVRSGTNWDMREHAGRLEFSFSPRSRPGGLYHQFGGQVGTICAFPGDFDARVAFALTKWPAWNGLYVSLTAFLGPENASYSAGRTAQIGGGEQYSSSTGFSSNFAAADRSGALRVARRNGLVTTYRLDGRRWQRMTSGREDEAAHLAVQVEGSSTREFDEQRVVVDFTDFSVTGVAPICPPGAALTG